LGTAWSFNLSGEDEEGADEEEEEDTSTAEETGAEEDRAATQGQGAPTTTPAMYMDDSQALEFLTSPAVLEAWPFMSDIHFLVRSHTYTHTLSLLSTLSLSLRPEL
jgi:hypothetical protein